jgi:hypothetical protein
MGVRSEWPGAKPQRLIMPPWARTMLTTSRDPGRAGERRLLDRQRRHGGQGRGIQRHRLVIDRIAPLHAELFGDGRADLQGRAIVLGAVGLGGWVRKVGNRVRLTARSTSRRGSGESARVARWYTNIF